MAALKTIRDNLKTAVANVTGLEVYDTVPGQITPPCVVIHPVTAEFLQKMGGTSQGQWQFAVIVIVGRNDEAGAQDALDDYISTSGASSIVAQLQSDTTLSSSVSWSKPTGISRYGEFVFAGASYLGAQVDVEVLE